MPEVSGVFEAFYAQRERRPDELFLRYGEHSWTWAAAGAQAHALACSFQDLGIEKGDRLAVTMPNWPEFVLTVLAAAEIGAVVVPLNPAYSPRDIQFVLRNTEAALVVTAETYGGVEYLEVFESLFSELPGLQYLVTVGEEDLWYDDRIFQFEDLVSAGRGHALIPQPVDAEDPFAILFTAGTSTKYKGVVQSHRSMLWTAGATAAGLGMTESDSTLCVVPMFNIFGLGVALLTAIVTGSGLVLQESFDVGEALELIERERPTVLHGVPTMFVMLLRDPKIETTDVSSLRAGLVAGAPVTAALAEEIRGRLVPDLEIAYGLTETAPTVSMTLPTDGPDRRSGSVGRPLPGVEVRILDDAEEPVPDGTEGEIAVRGPNLMSGYFRQPAATRNAMTADGLLKTGDLGTLDDEGYLHIDGRKRDLIIRGGYSVHPREVEDHLRSLPAVADAAVVGIPNEVLGELVCACVVLIEGALVTEEEIRELCRPTLAEYKLPDVVHFVEGLPRATTGSSRRAEIARRMRLELAARREEEAD
ncbi:MAG: AMP-binding protein [Candidatus Palauibacterales bacterium]|nr:AMP-binding protein [Candidatus Palauibacterales bacterium]